MSLGRMGVGAALAGVVCVLGLLAGASSALAETVTFKYTGKEQEFKVPAGVRSVHVVAVGAAGGSGVGVSSSGGVGGLGAVVSGNFGVKAGQTLYVEVGGKGGSPAEETGAFNGGGRSEGGGGGGGASDVRTVSRTEAKTLESRLLVAAGGGGGGLGFCAGGGGGAGGNAEEGGHAGFGCAAFGDGGGAGTSTKGGAGGTGRGGFGSGEEGALGAGGGGIEAEGGGGGGGLYGGGSGGEGYANGGGGGGSNLVPAGGEAKLTKGGEAASVTITYEPCNTKTGAATFSSTGKEQCYEVPAGVTSVHVVAHGASGASGYGASLGGLGEIVSGDLSVTEGQVLSVEVGGAPTGSGCYSSVQCVGGFNGGGSSFFGGGGGGASDVRKVSIGTEPSPGNKASLESRLLVAAGGGGGGSFGVCATGGAGGRGGNAGEEGTDGESCLGGEPGRGGGAGKETEGGAGGSNEGKMGGLGTGGNSGGLEPTGGGGGAGLYGGGGGGDIGLAAGISGAGGGGGGSNLVPTGGEAKLAKAGEEPSVTITVVAHETATSIKCSPASLLLGQSTTCTATVKDEATSGATAPKGPVAFKTSGEGSLEGTCTLKSRSASSSDCSVTYTPSEATKQSERTDTITATYEGDETHKASKGTTAVTVVVPAIPPVITPPLPLAPAAPVLSGLTAIHRCVSSVVLEHAHAGSGGLAFSFNLSEAANVTFAVLHRVGSPAWRKCPPVRGRVPGTYRSVGEVGALVPAGQQTISLGTAARARRRATVVRLTPGRHRISLAQIAQTRLSPGTYVVSAKAVNSAGQASGVDYAKFWVFS